ncbi:hypothetical protein F511_43520 [Dorcoceras hygrometricum]|uniref:Uncharacterized protein n=1 Tax=Dorcoceras hygrometricum TaxID=472368 RepID=A0A2Z7B909_9LAMI|nr:hypothetical protein F511_43520 [Dorcoceras hygrometricum]
MSSDFFWKCCVFENFVSLPVVGTRRSEFDEIGQQQVTVAESTRVNGTVACDWSNLEFQSLRLYWLLLAISDFFWKCCVFENFVSLPVVGTRRSEFDEIGQQQVTVAESTRVNGVLSLYQLVAMASSLFTNTLHVCFDSVLAMDNPGMVSIFEAQMASGLSGFLGCPAVLYEDALTEFFVNGSVRDGKVVSTIHGNQVDISEELFASSIHIIYRLGLRDAGIDQLNFHSVQLDYLQMGNTGNTDPNKTKAGNKYEVKPQYEELSKQINMQHAINQCYECMRAIKKSDS